MNSSLTDSLPPDAGGPTLLPPNVVPPNPASPENVESGGNKNSRASVWAHRLSLVVYVVFCVEVGMLLAILPWTRVWTENSLLIGFPVLKQFLLQNFVRGIVTGIGLLDVWLGIWEAVHYRENKPADKTA
ncbi:MAG TPA: hypothetical protein VN622_10255 [Clostridia bacterium]|nr:hypothetical protein [Clostridia bacterium]